MLHEYAWSLCVCITCFHFVQNYLFCHFLPVNFSLYTEPLMCDMCTHKFWQHMLHPFFIDVFKRTWLVSEFTHDTMACNIACAVAFAVCALVCIRVLGHRWHQPKETPCLVRKVSCLQKKPAQLAVQHVQTPAGHDKRSNSTSHSWQSRVSLSVPRE